jgi:SAM-dependent methyltransferase
MMPETYRLLAVRQSTYWWHRARRFMASSLLANFGLKGNCTLLDVGCGPGGNFDILNEFPQSKIIGVDLSPIALGEAKKSSGKASLVRLDINKKFPFRSETFDAATIFNVLYHSWISDESAILGEIFRVLKPGGLLLITEPAFPILFREMDVLAMGKKRYRICEIQSYARSSGFESLFGSYFTSFGFPVIILAKFLKKLNKMFGIPAPKKDADTREIGSQANEFLYRAARMEARLILSGFRIPVGTTLLFLGRRP